MAFPIASIIAVDTSVWGDVDADDADGADSNGIRSGATAHSDACCSVVDNNYVIERFQRSLSLSY